MTQDHGDRAFMAPAQQDTISAQEFLSVSEVFCNRYTLSQQASASQEHSEAGSLFNGDLAVRTLASGIHVSTAHLEALRSSEHSVAFPKSVCLVLSLAGASSEVNFGSVNSRVLNSGETMFFSFSDEANSIGRYREGQRNKSVLIQLRQDQVQDEELQEFIYRQTRASKFSSLGYQSRLVTLGDALFEPPMTGAVGNLMVESQVLELVARAIHTEETLLDRRHPHKDLFRMQRVRDLMMAHPERNFTLSELAREAGMSVSGLKVKFQAVYGKPVFAFLREIRMSHARHGLTHEGWSVKQAAAFTGFRHAANFTTAFRRQFGISPSDCF
ncbi:MAG: AraC family transcriptional regulator [Pseudomonadota bacterium]